MKKLFAILATSVVLILASCTDNSNNFVPVKETLYQKGSDTTITSKQFKLLKGDPKKVVNSCGKTVTIRKSYLDSIVSTSGLTLQGAPVTEQLYKKEVPAPAGIGNGNDDSDNGSIRSGSNHAGLFGLGLPDWAWWILFFILLVLLGLLIWALTRNRHNTHDHNHGTVNHNHTGTVNH